MVSKSLPKSARKPKWATASWSTVCTTSASFAWLDAFIYIRPVLGSNQPFARCWRGVRLARSSSPRMVTLSRCKDWAASLAASDTSASLVGWAAWAWRNLLSSVCWDVSELAYFFSFSFVLFATLLTFADIVSRFNPIRSASSGLVRRLSIRFWTFSSWYMPRDLSSWIHFIHSWFSLGKRPETLLMCNSPVSKSSVIPTRKCLPFFVKSMITFLIFSLVYLKTAIGDFKAFGKLYKSLGLKGCLSIPAFLFINETRMNIGR